MSIGRSQHGLLQDMERQHFRTGELTLTRVTLQIGHSRIPGGERVAQ